MNKKNILILILLPFFIIWLWLYLILNLTKPKTDITNTTNNNQIDKEIKENIKIQENIESIDKNEIKELTWELTIYIPKQFENHFFLKFFKNIEKKLNININIKNHIDEEYLNYDILLINNEELNKFSEIIYNIKFDNSIKFKVNTIFKNFLDSWILPFAIDPYVCFIKENINDCNIENIKAYKTNITLEKEDILYILLYDIFLTQNVDKLSNLISILNDKIKINKKLIKKQTKKYPNCTEFKDLCFLNKYDIIFWNLSLKDISEKFFDNNLEKYKIYNLDINDVYYVKIWWFIINKNSKNLKISTILINELLKSILDEKVNYRKYTISAYNEFYEKQKNNLDFEKIFINENNFDILSWYEEKIKNLKKDYRFKNLLINEYSLEWFISNEEIINLILK